MSSDAHKAKKQKLLIPEIILKEKLVKKADVFKGARVQICAFNVAGLRAMIKNKPETFRRIVQSTECDVLMFSEHKLNEENCEDVRLELRKVLPEFMTCEFAVSKAKKGYSGVCVLAKAKIAGASVGSPMKQKTLTDMFGAQRQQQKEENGTGECGGPKILSVKEGLLEKKHLEEGRCLTIEFEKFFAVFAYVPNSGQKLDRLDWRINTWEADMREHLNELQKSKPTVYGGDLNVAHLDIDVYNIDAKHIPKSAGTTPQEREAFQVMLNDCKMKDCFRHFNAEKTGHFSYWSQRVGNRPKNRGLRLDYFLASDSMFDENSAVRVVSSEIFTELEGSDHAPVTITLDVVL